MDKVLPVKPRDLCPIQQELWRLCSRCWDYSPSERMTVEEAIRIIDNISRIPQLDPDVNSQVEPSTTHIGFSFTSSTGIACNTLSLSPKPILPVALEENAVSAFPPPICSASIPTPPAYEQPYHAALGRNESSGLRNGPGGYVRYGIDEDSDMSPKLALYLDHEDSDDDRPIREIPISSRSALEDYSPVTALSISNLRDRIMSRRSILEEFLDSEREYWNEIMSLFRMLSRDGSEYLLPEETTTTLSRQQTTTSTTLSYSSYQSRVRLLAVTRLTDFNNFIGGRSGNTFLAMRQGDLSPLLANTSSIASSR